MTTKSCKSKSFFLSPEFENDADHFPSSLSSSTLDALKQFYAERDERAEQFAKLQAQAEEQHAGQAAKPLSMEAFGEDWNESQFWVSFGVCLLWLCEALVGLALLGCASRCCWVGCWNRADGKVVCSTRMRRPRCWRESCWMAPRPI